MLFYPRLDMVEAKEVIALLSGALTPLIAMIAAYIAWQQHRTNRSKLRLDLFDRRYAVYSGLTEFLGVVVGTPNFSVNQLATFNVSTANAAFLFGDDIKAYLASVREKALRLRLLQVQLAGAQGTQAERDAWAEEDHSLLLWFTQQFDLSRTTFAPYISFADL